MEKSLEAANAHWEYIRSVLEKHDLPDHDIAICGFHYITAFVHGWKHGKEEFLLS